MKSLTWCGCCLAALVLGASCSTPSGSTASAPTQRTFATAEDAVVALIDAARTGDPAAVRPIFGPGVEELESDSPAKTEGDLERLAAAYDRSHAIFIDGVDAEVGGGGAADVRSVTLAVGDDLWEFPVPIVREGDPPRWRFDTAAGVANVRRSRFDANEANAVDFLLACIPAQAEYKALGVAGVPAFASRFRSEPGTRNGLWWPDDLAPPASPLGPMVDEAAAAAAAPFDPRSSASYRGYRYRILTGAGPSAPGGAAAWLDANGNLVGGFAFIAWPDVYGETAVRTILVAMDGSVWTRDLGPETDTVAARITVLDPGDGWSR